MTKFNILILEDTAAILDMLETLVRVEKHIPYPACLPSLAFKVLQDEKIDLIISDINMPEMTGIEFVRKIRKDEIQIPVIFYSAEVDIDEDELQNLKASFITKHGSLEKLRHEISNKLHKSSV